MSKTDAPRPYPIFFTDYTRDEMKVILEQTASSFIELANPCKDNMPKYHHAEAIKFYAKTILEVFYPICKDLNEIQYLIQIYYDQLMSSLAAEEQTDENNQRGTGPGGEDRMMSDYRRIKPFLKQALTQIYLRQSMYKPPVKTRAGEEVSWKKSASLKKLSHLI